MATTETSTFAPIEEALDEIRRGRMVVVCDDENRENALPHPVHIAYPSKYALTAHTLWIAHTWLMESWESTPDRFPFTRTRIREVAGVGGH